jgi:hypothetical protein
MRDSKDSIHPIQLSWMMCNVMEQKNSLTIALLLELLTVIIGKMSLLHVLNTTRQLPIRTID